MRTRIKPIIPALIFILLICFTPKTALASEPETVSLVMVGDILLHTPIEEVCVDEEGNYNFDAIFSKTKTLIGDADLALVNQEVIIGGKELGISGYPAFNAPYEIGDALAKAGFDVVCHATNHALDKGKRGITNTLDYWSANHPEIAILGI
ncbi:MAG: CapA family protein, partial [Clostridia bacterium]|nr:CapA family protein [Clostridia bacterium]